MNPQSWNMYAYVNNNPLADIDPTGLCSEGPNGTVHEDTPGDCGGGSTTVNGGPPDPVANDTWWNGTIPWYYGYTFFYGGGISAAASAKPATPPNPGPPPTTGTCVDPTVMQRPIRSALSFLSKRLGRTVGYGTGGSIGAGRKPIAINFGVSMQFVASPDGTVGKQFSYTPNTTSYFSAGTTGWGALFGLQFSASNARTIGDLAGGGVDFSAMAADGVGVGTDVSIGNNGDRVITQGTLTVGFGTGGKGAAGVLTQTMITPFCP